MISKTVWQWIEAFACNRSANVAMIFAIGVIPIGGSMGVAVDYGRIARAKSDLQRSVDTALIAGLRAATDQRQSAAERAFDTNFTNRDVVSTSRAFDVSDASKIVATASADVELGLARIIGLRTSTVAAKGEIAVPEQKSNACILLVDPNANQSFLVNSGARIDAPECEIHVRSNANPAAIINAGTTLDVKRICIKSANIIKNTSANMPIETKCNPIEDPYPGKLPDPTVGACTNTRQVYDVPSSGIHVMPANSVWCDVIFNGSPQIEFAPGLHIIKGRMIINANSVISGNGVTFFYPDLNSEIRFNGGIKSTLSAPTSGPYSGILMFEKWNNPGTTQFIFNGSLGEDLQGLIYLPKRNVTYNSVSNINASKVQMVFNTLIINDINWKFAPGSTPIGGPTSGPNASATSFISR